MESTSSGGERSRFAPIPRVEGLEARKLLAAVVYQPLTSAELTAALNGAQLGDTIILRAGTTYTGSFALPNKASGSGYITIQSSALSSLPQAGTRVGLADAANMPQIVASPGGAAIRTVPGAHHFKFVGVDVKAPADNSFIYNLILLGDSGPNQDTMAEVPHDLVFDRCIIRANSTMQGVRRGIALNSASTDVLSSYLWGFKEAGADSQAIAGWNGPGPFNIINNYLEGAGENVIFGGADPSIPNLVPSDIVVRRNHFFKPLSWKVGDPSYAGTPWTIKNLFELKNAQRVTVEGNILEHNWVHGQVGFAVLLTPRNQNGTAPWSVVQDVAITNNVIRGTSSVFNNLGFDAPFTSQQTKRVRIENNLMYDIGGPQWGGDGRLYQMLDRTADYTINHNTGIQPGTALVGAGGAHTGFVFTNNLQAHGSYGVFGDNVGVGNAALNTYFPGAVFQKDVLMGGQANASLYNQYPGGWNPTSLAFPSSWNGVMVNQASPGANFAGYKVVAGSAYDNAGTDGKDIGADIDAVAAATAGAISGVWSAPTAPSPGGPYNVNEGSSITLAGTSLPGAQLQWDLNYDGTTFDVDASGPNPVFSAANIDGAATRTIAARTTTANVRTTTVRIANVAPRATFAAGAAVALGTPSSVSFSNRTDPSPADVAAGFRYSYDFNNDGDFTDAGDVANSSSASASFTFASAGTFGVRGRISDNDGGFTGYTTAVTVSPASGSTVTLSATADAHVRDGSFAGTNFGSATILEVKRHTSGFNRQAYFRFNLASLANITSAKLRLHGRLTSTVTGGLDAAVYPVSNTGWTESTLTFNNRPAAGGTALSQVRIVGTTAKYYEFDVTNYLKQQKAAGKTLVIFVVKATVSNAGLMNFSSRNASSNRPQLLVAQTPLKTLVVSSNALNVNEGSSSSFSVRLGAQPTANVTVTIARQSGDGSLTSSLTSLLFTPTNWNTARTVSILAGQDADATNGSATFTLSASGYAVRSVVATEVDDEIA
jgi:hypothetical protein